MTSGHPNDVRHCATVYATVVYANAAAQLFHDVASSGNNIVWHTFHALGRYHDSQPNHHRTAAITKNSSTITGTLNQCLSRMVAS